MCNCLAVNLDKPIAYVKTEYKHIHSHPVISTYKIFFFKVLSLGKKSRLNISIIADNFLTATRFK